MSINRFWVGTLGDTAAGHQDIAARGLTALGQSGQAQAVDFSGPAHMDNRRLDVAGGDSIILADRRCLNLLPIRVLSRAETCVTVSCYLWREFIYLIITICYDTILFLFHYYLYYFRVLMRL